ncbi:MAG: hypothetical protein D6744_01045 [Planctomycetota bacterium]|nr:MAG: hypothetical protein D6744_01045 [Planctomycetota bacterium]
MGSEPIAQILSRARELLSSGRPGAALRVLRSVGDEYMDADDRIEYVALRALALSQSGRGRPALELLNNCLEDEPDSPMLHAASGIVLANAGDYDAARDELEYATELGADDPDTLLNLAMVYVELRDYDRAAAAYAEAAQRGADLQFLLPRQAEVYVELNQPVRARETLRRYLSLVPDDAEQWISLGILCSDEGRFDEATEAYRRAERLDRDSTSLRLNWGVSAVRAHDVAEADRQLAHLRALEPRAARTILLEAYIREERGEMQAAERAYQRALKACADESVHEQAYTLEMAMDFFARRRRTEVCDELLAAAYTINACTVELCEAYREAQGRLCDAARWFSVMIEADYRTGLSEVHALDAAPVARPRRYQRCIQVVARDRDEAISIATDVVRRFGERNVRVYEIAGEDALEGTQFAGVYEIERDAFIVPEEDGQQH